MCAGQIVSERLLEECLFVSELVCINKMHIEFFFFFSDKSVIHKKSVCLNGNFSAKKNKSMNNLHQKASWLLSNYMLEFVSWDRLDKKYKNLLTYCCSSKLELLGEK